MSRTVLRASFRSRAIALIFRFCTKYARRTLAIVSTVTIPLLTPGANHALRAGLPPGGGVNFGRRSPPKRGQNCTPLNTQVGVTRPTSESAARSRAPFAHHVSNTVRVRRDRSRQPTSFHVHVTRHPTAARPDDRLGA